MINSYDNGRQLGIDAYNGPRSNESSIYADNGLVTACESSGVICDGPQSWNGLPQGSWDGQLGGAPNSVDWDASSQTLTIVSKLWDWNLRHAGSLSKVYDQAESTQKIKFIAPNVIKLVITTSMHINYLNGTYNQQVSPYVFLNGNYHKVASYFGNSPFTNDSNIYNQPIPYHSGDLNLLTQDTNEKWSGLYNDSDFGLAFVWKDNDKTVVAGNPARSNPDNSRYSFKSNYMYHYRGFNNLTGNSTIENEFYLVLGSPSDARCWAYSLNGYSSSCSTCTTPAAPTLAANPSSINSGQSSQLSATGCPTTGIVTWSTGQTGNSISVSPLQTTTYTATCTTNGCTSSTAGVQVAVITQQNPLNLSLSIWKAGATGVRTKIKDLVEGDQINPSSFNGGQANWFLAVDNGQVTNSSASNYYDKVEMYINRPTLPTEGWGPEGVAGGDGGPYGLNGRDGGQSPVLGSYQLSAKAWKGSTQLLSKTVNFTIASCTPPAAPTLAANPASINPGQSSLLTATGCSTGNVLWSTGQTANSISVNPSQTTTYTATCTTNGCTSVSGQVTVPVGSGNTINCSSLNGHFDTAGCDIIGGWAFDSSQPNTVINVDIFEGNTLIQGNIPANDFRQDLLNAGMGNGVHGFQISTPSSLKNGQNRTIKVLVSGCPYELNNSPKTIQCSSGARFSAIATQELASFDDTNTSLKVFPNPSNGELNVDFYAAKNEPVTLQVLDLKGNIFYEDQVKDHGNLSRKIVLTEFQPGIFIVRLKKVRGNESKKVFIFKD